MAMMIAKGILSADFPFFFLLLAFAIIALYPRQYLLSRMKQNFTPFVFCRGDGRCHRVFVFPNVLVDAHLAMSIRMLLHGGLTRFFFQ